MASVTPLVFLALAQAFGLLMALGLLFGCVAPPLLETTGTTNCVVGKIRGLLPALGLLLGCVALPLLETTGTTNCVVGKIRGLLCHR